MKRCLLVCEGPFDELIFSALKDIFDESLLDIKPLCRCCLDTPDLRNNVEILVGEILSKEHGYLRTDFDEVCFLVDSDGVYTPDTQVIENLSISLTKYNDTTIECRERRTMILRNRRRRNNIADLLVDRKYWIFYNSRNLEHAFDSSLSGNLRDTAKKRFALTTSSLYEGNSEDFIRKLASMNVSATNNIFESWKYLSIDNNSLSSCSNIFIFVLMHFYAVKDEYKPLVKELYFSRNDY